MTQNLGVEYVVGGMESVNNQRTNGLQLHPSQKNCFLHVRQVALVSQDFVPNDLASTPNTKVNVYL